MVNFEKFELVNGLKVLLHQDRSTPLAAVNLLFKAGSKYDPANKSGLAHLFEHLMFSGTPQVPDFDLPIQEAGGENNAYTNSDYANYYSYGPAENIETLLWLEADRMHDLSVLQDALEIQQQVVIEELHETCFNRPYGDVWHHVLPWVYRDHPYHWPVIGKDQHEIAAITFDDVLDFRRRYYHPGNAILSVAGNIDPHEIERMLNVYFCDLACTSSAAEGSPYDLDSYRSTYVQLPSKVPVEAFFMIFPMPERSHSSYYSLDLLSDLLADGRSSILYQQMVKETHLLSSVDAYITGTVDCGLFVIEGRLSELNTWSQVAGKIDEIIQTLIHDPIKPKVMEKLKNNVESSITFAESGTLNKAMNLAFFEMLGDVHLINDEARCYEQVSIFDLQSDAAHFLDPSKASIFHYRPESAT